MTNTGWITSAHPLKKRGGDATRCQKQLEIEPMANIG